MKTGCFYTYTGPGRICVARSAPRNTAAGFRYFKKMAPGEWFKTTNALYYRKMYFETILGVLDPKRVLDELHELANGAEPVLMCHERPPFNTSNWCHRRMIAEWFADKLGIDVPELVVVKASANIAKPQRSLPGVADDARAAAAMVRNSLKGIL